MSGKVIILGGGIGGLCASIALRQAGVDAVVYEQAKQFDEVGAGIQVWVKGMEALRQLGVADAVRSAGAEVRAHRFFNAAGTPLYSADLAGFARQHETPMPVMISRAALVGSLAAGVDSETVHLGRRIVSVEHASDSVTVTFEDGTSDQADLLIAADGINSMTRCQLFPDVRIRTASYRYVRSLVAHPAPVGQNVFAMFLGRGNRIAVGDCGDGMLYWLVGMKNPTVPLDGDPGRLKADLLRRFASFPEGIASVIDATPADTLIHHTVRDLDPIARWGKGRVILLGDAAHATTPNLGRGSGQAMLDAITLADLLRTADLTDAGQLGRVLDTYSRVRKPEAEQLQRTSRSIGNITSWSSPVMAMSRDVIMKTIAGRRQIAGIERQFAETAAIRALSGESQRPAHN
ncbi:FAD-dependent monooxygenase [Paramicrobacterium fandaimingii]|uniref:FAD-dependent monooxygenase n=1 Tax=Paramicrobacterium fandaimingii TaxID=2708079 RepID=UPI0014220BB4|nr:FAD-dependent monooxygenase [Microbacterium fandaimingii]